MNVHIAICLVFSWWCQDWTTFKEQHNKSYSDSLEEEKRMTIFYENQKKIAQHNALFTQGRVKHSVVMNKFGDLDAAEIKAMMNGFTKEDHKPSTKVHEATNEALPATVDWRTKGAVTPVKDQGECGSCWSFSATGSLEGQLFLKTGKLVSLSEQNLIDCSGDYGNHGCNGGLMDNAFQYYKDKGCLATEESYPYKAQVGTCQFSSDNVGGTDIGYVDVPSGDESALQSAVANFGPVSVAIDASNWSFHSYSGGVYDEPNCSSTNLDHGVLVVGYGTENGTDYWLVKNSWGPEWGLDGYIKMSRNSDNQCGVATTASYPNF